MLARRYGNKRAREVYQDLKESNFIFVVNDVEFIAIEMLNQVFLERIGDTDISFVSKVIEGHNSNLEYPIPVKLEYGENIGINILSDESFRNNDSIVMTDWYNHCLLSIHQINGVSILACLVSDIKEKLDNPMIPLKNIRVRYLSFEASTTKSRSFIKVLALYVSIRNERFKINILDKDRPKDLKIWNVYCDGIDGEVNSYVLDFESALNMCVASYEANEGHEYTISSSNCNMEKNNEDTYQ